MIKKSEKLKRTVLRKSNILTYCVDTVKLPDGNIAEYDVMLHNGGVAVLAVTKEQKIVMVRQYRHAFDRITLEVPAGKRDGDEEFLTAAKRELEEEAGYRCGKIEHFMTINTAIAYCDEVIEVFLATDLVKTEQHLDSDEFVEVEEYDLDELVDRVFKCEIKDSKTVAVLMAYKVYRDKK